MPFFVCPGCPKPTVCDDEGACLNMIKVGVEGRPLPDPTPFLIEGRYVVTFVGTTMGAVVCESSAQLTNLLNDTFPNPGCPIRTHLFSLKGWDTDADGVPFCVFYTHQDEQEQYIVSVFRERELQS